MLQNKVFEASNYNFYEIKMNKNYLPNFMAKILLKNQLYKSFQHFQIKIKTMLDIFNRIKL